MSGKETFFFKLHRDGKTGLTTHSTEDTVRLFFYDNSLYGFKSKGFKIYAVRHCGVSHDGSGVGVYEYDLNSILTKSTASLSACVVKLCRLADNYGT